MLSHTAEKAQYSSSSNKEGTLYSEIMDNLYEKRNTRG